MNEKRSILVLNNGYVCGVPSGGDKHVLDVAGAWSREADVTFVMPSFVSGLAPAGAKVVACPARPLGGLVSMLFGYAARMFRVLRLQRRLPADLVVASPALYDLLPALKHKRRFGSVCAVYLFHLAPRRAAASPVLRVQYALAAAAQYVSTLWLRRADVVFVDNPGVGQALLERGLDPRQLVRHRPAVNVAGVQSAAPVPRFDALFVGRLMRSKGVYDLLDAFADLPWSLGIVGDGQERKGLAREIGRRGLSDRVTLTGPLPEAEVYGLLRGCRVFVFPSREEGYGIAVAEALVAGKPVVAYDLDAYRTAFPGGLRVVAPGDTLALARAVRAVLGEESGAGRGGPPGAALEILDAEQAAAHELAALRRALQRPGRGRRA